MTGCRESFSYYLKPLKEVAQIGTKNGPHPSNHVQGRHWEIPETQAAETQLRAWNQTTCDSWDFQDA